MVSRQVQVGFLSLQHMADVVKACKACGPKDPTKKVGALKSAFDSDVMKGAASCIQSVENSLVGCMGQQIALFEDMEEQVAKPMDIFLAQSRKTQEKIDKDFSKVVQTAAKAKKELVSQESTCEKSLTSLKSAVVLANEFNDPKAVKKIESARKSTQKDFQKYEALLAKAQETQKGEWDATPGYLRELEVVEMYRLSQARVYIKKLHDILLAHAQSLEAAARRVEAVITFDENQQLKTAVEKWGREYGICPEFFPEPYNLPCKAADLEGANFETVQPPVAPPVGTFDTQEFFSALSQNSVRPGWTSSTGASQRREQTPSGPASPSSSFGGPSALSPAPPQPSAAGLWVDSELQQQQDMGAAEEEAEDDLPPPALSSRGPPPGSPSARGPPPDKPPVFGSAPAPMSPHSGPPVFGSSSPPPPPVSSPPPPGPPVFASSSPTHSRAAPASPRCGSGGAPRAPPSPRAASGEGPSGAPTFALPPPSPSGARSPPPPGRGKPPPPGRGRASPPGAGSLRAGFPSSELASNSSADYGSGGDDETI